jgi:hypothetical protein
MPFLRFYAILWHGNAQSLQEFQNTLQDGNEWSALSIAVQQTPPSPPRRTYLPDSGVSGGHIWTGTEAVISAVQL